MKLTSIASNVAHVIRDHQSDQQAVMAIEFTDQNSKGKPADGCLVVTLVDASHYSIDSYDCRFMETGDDILAMDLAAFLECDDDLDQRQTLIDDINQQVADDPQTQTTLVTGKQQA